MQDSLIDFILNLELKTVEHHGSWSRADKQAMLRFQKLEPMRQPRPAVLTLARLITSACVTSNSDDLPSQYYLIAPHSQEARGVCASILVACSR